MTDNDHESISSDPDYTRISMAADCRLLRGLLCIRSSTYRTSNSGFVGILVLRHQPFLGQCVAQSRHRNLGADSPRSAVLRCVRSISIPSDCWKTVVEGVGRGHNRTASDVGTDRTSSSRQVPAMGILPHNPLALGRLADEPGTADNSLDHCHDYWLAGHGMVRREPLRPLPSHTLRLGGWNRCCQTIIGAARKRRLIRSRTLQRRSFPFRTSMKDRKAAPSCGT